MVFKYSFAFLIILKLCHSQVKVTDFNPESVQIVGLFEHTASVQHLAFKESLQRDQSHKIIFDPVVVNLTKTDSFSAYNALRANKTIAPIAIFGPQNPITDTLVKEYSVAANIPFIQATWQPVDNDPDADLPEDEEPPFEETKDDDVEENPEPTFKPITINFFPDANEISKAYAKLLKFYEWESFAVLYEDDFGLIRVQKILAEHTDQYPVIMMKLDPTGNNQKIFKQLYGYQHISRILIDCHIDKIMDLMNQAKEMKMDNLYKHYVFVSMDTSMVAAKLVESNFLSNITWLSISNYDKITDAQHFLATRVAKWKTKIVAQSPPVAEFPIEALILDDVANHLAKATDSIEDLKGPLLNELTEPWIYGAQFQQAILNTKTLGVTGNITFDENGKRKDYILHVNEINIAKRNTIGRWESANPDVIIRNQYQVDVLSGQQSSKEFIIISRVAKPYFAVKKPCPKDAEDCEEDTTNELYEGFAVDLVDEIFKYLREEKYNFTYKFIRVADESYGKYNNQSKKWSGLVGKLLDKEADLAVCDLTITKERKKVVDFSVPFMSLGISILFTQDVEIEPNTFAFLNPYTTQVWIYTATAYLVVSIILFVCSRISPADWENPQPCDKDPEELENIWNFKNCTWLTMGSIMTQGCDILPKAIGTRWICGMWWFFAMIVCQTYIAQLSASMTDSLESEPINSVEDLAKQTKIMYGAIKGGSTYEFFKTSKDKMYRKMFENMDQHPAVFVASNEEGVERVLRGKNKYAFFMESCMIEYKLKRECRLKKVGGELDSKDYGIAMPANSPFRTIINRAILKLQGQGKLDDIKKKWWEERDGVQDCEEPVDKNDVQGDLELQHLKGAFLVLIVGLVLCLFITAAEFMNEVRNIVVREKVSHKEVFIKELKASLNVFQLQKPVIRNPSRAPSIASTQSSKSSDSKKKRRAHVIENFMDFEKNPQ